MPLLFSYGTLRQANVQLATFGRLLSGSTDVLIGYECSMIAIGNSAGVMRSGKARHPIARFTGMTAHHVKGTVFEISGVELAQADRYEDSAYMRVNAPLQSGLEAWVYVDVRQRR